MLPQITSKDYITIVIRLRNDDTTTQSTTTEVIEIKICIRFNCDTTTMKNWRSFFACVESRRMEAGVRYTS